MPQPVCELIFSRQLPVRVHLFSDIWKASTTMNLPTLMPKYTVLDVLKILVGEIVINMVVGGEVTTLKGLEEISGIIITEMLINV
ncbi:hypothetical protein Bca52824_038904 [Brassica carinata]|uniref:Uncharacterized protein n=1 Tax=Brassica carinata TaxID=52824 RepID=A0A8X7RQ69_BRACI|nr:hypothetical protein Bca52824_038904 [Brassica carinata]